MGVAISLSSWAQSSSVVIDKLESVKKNDQGKSDKGSELVSYRSLESIATTEQLNQLKQSIVEGHYIVKDEAGNTDYMGWW